MLPRHVMSSPSQTGVRSVRRQIVDHKYVVCQYQLFPGRYLWWDFMQWVLWFHLKIYMRGISMLVHLISRMTREPVSCSESTLSYVTVVGQSPGKWTVVNQLVRSQSEIYSCSWSKQSPWGGDWARCDNSDSQSLVRAEDWRLQFPIVAVVEWSGVFVVLTGIGPSGGQISYTGLQVNTEHPTVGGSRDSLILSEFNVLSF